MCEHCPTFGACIVCDHDHGQPVVVNLMIPEGYTCWKCGELSYPSGGRPICYHCGAKSK